MRRAADEEGQAAREQLGVMRRAAADQAETVRKQIDAALAQGKEIRDVARAQLLPIVFALFVQSYAFGPDDEFDLAEGQIGFPYHLTNEGDGIALKIRHGVEIDGEKIAFDGRELRSLRAGETYPSPERDPKTRMLVRRPWVVVKAEHELPAGWENRSRNYWVQFENVFGDRFESFNPTDPTESTTFRQLPSE